MVKQISIFVENKCGRLAKVTSLLSESNINIRALSVADTTDFGILRLIVDKPDVAEIVLKENGFAVKATQVIAIEITDEPGGLAKALELLQETGLAIEYMYAFLGRANEGAVVILKLKDNQLAVDFLTKNGVNVLSADKIYNL